MSIMKIVGFREYIKNFSFIKFWKNLTQKFIIFIFFQIFTLQCLILFLLYFKLFLYFRYKNEINCAMKF